MRKAILATALLLTSVVPASAAPNQWQHHVRVTYYTDSGVMASGRHTYNGAAACSYNFSFGTKITFPDGREVQCWDRGRLGSTGWVDIYVPNASYGRANIAGVYGDYATVQVEELD